MVKEHGHDGNSMAIDSWNLRTEYKIKRVFVIRGRESRGKREKKVGETLRVKDKWKILKSIKFVSIFFFFNCILRENSIFNR